MTRCRKCGYFIDNTLSLGGCYCGYKIPCTGNLHDIESFQPIELYDETGTEVTGNRTFYNAGLEPYYAYATSICENFFDWFDVYGSRKRLIKVWYKAGHIKTALLLESLDMVIKDGYLPDGTFDYLW